jgi:hypothetical protein
VNGRLEGIRVLKGVEADILQDRRIDFERVLARPDFRSPDPQPVQHERGRDDDGC